MLHIEIVIDDEIGVGVSVWIETRRRK